MINNNNCLGENGQSKQKIKLKREALKMYHKDFSGDTKNSALI